MFTTLDHLKLRSNDGTLDELGVFMGFESSLEVKCLEIGWWSIFALDLQQVTLASS